MFWGCSPFPEVERSRCEKRKLIVAAALLAATVVFAAGKTLYVKRVAKLRAAAKASSASVGKLAAGTQVTVLEQAKSWRRIRGGSVEGWVHKSRLTRKKPSREAVADAKAMETGDIQAVRVSASASIRGLTPKAKAYADSKGITQDVQDSVDRITAFQIKPAALEAFMAQGKLGEYSEGE